MGVSSAVEFNVQQRSAPFPLRWLSSDTSSRIIVLDRWHSLSSCSVVCRHTERRGTQIGGREAESKRWLFDLKFDACKTTGGIVSRSGESQDCGTSSWAPYFPLKPLRRGQIGHRPDLNLGKANYAHHIQVKVKFITGGKWAHVDS